MYCTGNSIILLLSTINCIIVAYILVQHMRVKGATVCKNYFKVKSLILILMLFYELTVFGRYFLNVDKEEPTARGLYDLILIGSQTIQSIILFLICYFFMKKASHFLQDNSKIRKRLRIFMAIALSAVIIASIG